MATRFVPSYKTCTEVTAQCPVAATTYGYYPSFGGSIFFTVFFGILAIYAVAIGIRKRAWTFTIGLGMGAIMECLGYIGRTLMSQNPWSDSAFKLQIVCLILAPSLIAASIYLTLKHLVLYFGPEHSVLRPNRYPWVFIGCDIISICLQAIGGGVAASGSNGNRTLLNASNGLIIGGIGFQVATMLCAGLFAVVFYIRFQKARKQAPGSPTSEDIKAEYDQNRDEPNTKRNMTIFCAALSLAYLAILIRCVYRLPEMAGGWGNPRMRNEKEFLVLDGAMVALGTLALTVAHPAIFFKRMCRG